MRHLVVLLLALAGCKYLDQPKKVAELEKRLDEVSTALSDLTGEPVGLRPGAKTADHGKKAAGKAKRAKADQDAKDVKAGKTATARAARDDNAAEPADPDHAAAETERSDRDAGPAADHPAGDWRAAAHDASAEPAAAPAAEPAKAPASVHWSYGGDDGPSAWSKLDPSFAACAKGDHQSPIDILPKHSEAPEVIFVYRPSAATVVDDGHTLEVDLAPGSFIVVDGTRYELIQFHVHTPSEHTIAGDSFPMELDLVHRSKAGRVVVVAVLFTEGEASTALAAVWKAAPKAKGAAKLKRPFDPGLLLPKDQAAYRYDGSLTEPPCTEGVIWEVLRRPRTEDEQTIAGLRKHFGANARPVQELGDRALR